MYLPYCPVNYFVKPTCVSLLTTQTAWNPLCCQPCQRCAANQQKIEDWQPCSGAKIIDTKLEMCADTCSTGFYQQNNTCIKCRALCF